MRHVLVALVRIYQRGVSRWTPRTCRFDPTCSEYAAQALTKYGAAWGAWLAIKRLSRCHPFHAGGVDPVP